MQKLGKEFEKHLDGLRLKAACVKFREKLCTDEIFDTWKSKAMEQKFDFSIEKVFVAESLNAALQIKVNFPAFEFITLQKDVQSLKTLGFRVPLDIINRSHSIGSYCPFAISIIGNVEIYKTTIKTVKSFFFSNRLLFTL